MHVWTASRVVRGGGWLGLARIAQMGLGLASLAIATRSLGLAGFGELSTVLALAMAAYAILNFALSDAVAATGRSLGGLFAPLTLLLAGCVLVGAPAWVSAPSLLLVLITVWVYVATGVLTASAIGHARRDGRFLAMAACQVAGTLLTLLIVGLLAVTGREEWELFFVAYAAQPLSMAWLALRTPVRVEGTARGPVEIWQLSRSYLLTWIAFSVTIPALILMLRALAGPEVVGAFASILRLLDVVAGVPPLLSAYILPAMVDMRRSPGAGARLRVAQLNMMTASLGTIAVVLGLQFIWAFWTVLYPDEPLDVTFVLLLGAAVAMRVAVGLPDRVLQSAGHPGAVAKLAVIQAVLAPASSLVLISVAGAVTGAGAGYLVATLFFSLALLRRSDLPRPAVTGHVALTAVAALAASTAAVTADQRSLVLSSALGMAGVLVSSAVAWIAHGHLGRAEGETKSRHASATERGLVTAKDGEEMSRSKTLALVLTYSAPNALTTCLRAISAQTRPPDAVLIIDNAGNPPAALTGLAPTIPGEVRRLDTNTGPAGGHAYGLAEFLAHADMTHAWVMDDDCTPDPGVLEALLAEAEAAEGPSLLLPRVVARGQLREYPSWCGFVVDRSAVERAGLPCKEFFWWAEDTEYVQVRMPARGVDVRHIDGPVVVHESAHSPARPPWKMYYEVRNTTYVLWYLKPRTPRNLMLLTRSITLLFGISMTGKSRRESLRMHRRGLIDGFAGRLGCTVVPAAGEPREGTLARSAS